MANEQSFTIDPNIKLEFRPEVLYLISNAASKNAGRRAIKYIKQELTRADRMDTGTLASSFVAEFVYNPIGPQYEIVSNLPPLEPTGRTLADIVNNGTGVYGPYGVPIVSPYGNVMRFNPSRKNTKPGRRGVRNSKTTGRFESNYVYAISVAGQPGTGFIEKAMARIKIVDFII